MRRTHEHCCVISKTATSGAEALMKMLISLQVHMSWHSTAWYLEMGETVTKKIIPAALLCQVLLHIVTRSFCDRKMV